VSNKKQAGAKVARLPALRVDRQTPCDGVAVDMRVAGRLLAYDMICGRCGLNTTVVARGPMVQQRADKDRLLVFLETVLTTVPFHSQHHCTELPVPEWF